MGLILVAVQLCSTAMAAADEPEPEQPPAQEPETPAPPTSEPASGEDDSAPAPAETKATKAPRGRPKKAKGRARKPSGYAVLEVKLRDHPPPPPSGNLHLYNPYRAESLKVNIYNRDGSYNVDALEALQHLLRCKRTDTERDMEPSLFVILSHVYDHFGERRIEVTSGYRNQRHTTSNHPRGSATDIMLPGVKPAEVRAYVETLDAGGMGIGLYPRSGFVHVDVRPPPSYRWIDYSPTNPDDPKRLPPRNFKKRKHLQS
jgi:uncharacterized protein YcbK (DUF882 family)